MAYSFQTFSFEQVLTSAQVNQIEVNIRDHIHGRDSVGKVGLSWPRTAKTGTFTAVAADVGEIFDVTSGTFTIDFDAAATLGAGWAITIANTGSGKVTLDPNGAETIDGKTTLDMPAGRDLTVWSDGTNLHTFASGSGQIVLLQSQEASADSSLDFTTLIDTTFASYVLVGAALNPATDAQNIRIKLSDDALSTFLTIQQNLDERVLNATAVSIGQTSSDAPNIVNNVGNGAAESCSFVLWLHGLADSTFETVVHGQGVSRRSGTGGGGTISQVFLGTTTAVAEDSIRVLFSSGNIDTGRVTLYGVKHD